MKSTRFSAEERDRFIKRHASLVKGVAMTAQKNHYAHRTLLAKHLIKFARKELSYSPKTVDYDVCHAILRAYHLMEKGGQP